MKSRGFPRPIPAERSLEALAVAALLAVIALLVRLAVGLSFAEATPFTTFYVAIIISTSVGGLEAGLLSAVVGALLVARFLPAASGVSFGGYVYYAVVASFIIWLGCRYRSLLRSSREREDVAQRHRDLLAEQNRALSLIAIGSPLPEVLGELARSIESFTQHSTVASILLLDDSGRHVHHGAGPNLPPEFITAIDGSAIGPRHGSCGTAAFTKQEVHVRDIENDPLWADYRQHALPHGFKACWATPLLSHTGAIYGTFALYFFATRDPYEHERDVVSLLARTAVLAIEADRAAIHRRLILGEMAHRVKNVLAVVHSLARHTLRPHLQSGSFEDFEQRLMSLATIQDVLTRTDKLSVDLRDLIEQVVVKPFMGHEERFVINGPSVQVVGQVLISLAMAFHELCTNSMKYGALSSSDGRVHISWKTDSDGAKFLLDWKEKGGPPVKAPERSGFGSLMIKRALSSATRGDAVMDFQPDGLHCTVVMPLSELVDSAPDDGQAVGLVG